MRRLPSFAFALLALVLGASVPARADEPLDALQERIISVSEQVKPSVVHIEAIVKIDDRRNQVTGSGVVASEDGEILTNHHVVERAEKVTVSVPGRRTKYPARILGTDKQTDLAVLRIEPETKLPAAKFAPADSVRVGQWVLAIGNPYGLDGTVSFGIVSAKGRNLGVEDVLNDFIQTDAMIDLGSSGGPLVDLEGRVVGINSRGQGRGIGFTIPIATALEVRRQIEHGGIERGWVGITMQPLDRDLARYFGVPDASGVVVNSVSAGSPAKTAGLEPGDVITRFDGVGIEAEKDEELGAFQRQVARIEPGRSVALEILRGGKPRSLKLTIGTQPRVEPEVVESDAGFHVQEITESLWREQRLDTRRGAFVAFVARGSPASEAGLAPGDVVERVEKETVDDLSGFRRAMATVKDRDTFLITARRGSETKFLLVKRGDSLRAAAQSSGAETPTARDGDEPAKP
ncbi:MAG TPA: trypsin-like peptidase domain-containing protein [Myxococcota bacterium]|nr:trypsin-like peptidase domain-containing protein [Myxococcota bacterium]